MLSILNLSLRRDFRGVVQDVALEVLFVVDIEDNISHAMLGCSIIGRR